MHSTNKEIKSSSSDTYIWKETAAENQLEIVLMPMSLSKFNQPYLSVAFASKDSCNQLQIKNIWENNSILNEHRLFSSHYSLSNKPEWLFIYHLHCTQYSRE